jgi:hypothetical protein
MKHLTRGVCPPQGAGRSGVPHASDVVGHALRLSEAFIAFKEMLLESTSIVDGQFSQHILLDDIFIDDLLMRHSLFNSAGVSAYVSVPFSRA